MSDKADTRVSTSLDPQTFMAIDGYGEDTAKFVGSAVNAANDAYVTLGKLHDARVIAESNGAWTKEQRALIVGREAEKHRLRIIKRFELAGADIKANIEHTVGQLMEPLVEQAGRGTLNGEVRAHFKSLDRPEREAQMRQALDEGDEATIAAILGAQPFLSGFTKIDHDHYLRLYHEKKRPDLVRRIEVMERFRERVEAIWPILYQQFGKAIGVPPDEALAIQAADARARAALDIQPTD